METFPNIVTKIFLVKGRLVVRDSDERMGEIVEEIGDVMDIVYAHSKEEAMEKFCHHHYQEVGPNEKGELFRPFEGVIIVVNETASAVIR